MKCSEITELLDLAPTQTLSDEEQGALASHVAGCEACALRAKGIDQAFARVAQEVEDRMKPLSSSLRDRVLAAVEDQALEAPGKTPPKTGSPPAAAPAPINGAIADLIQVACTYCHGALPRAESVFCSSCLTPHHEECFTKHGACSTLGCEETRWVRPGRKKKPNYRRRQLISAAASLLLLTTGGIAAWNSDDPAATEQPNRTPIAAAPGAGPLTVTAELERTQLHDSDRAVHVVVSLQASGVEQRADWRPPAQIALVVDCSSSMSADQKIGFAREAVKAFMTGLGPRDSCTVLGFSNGARTIVPWFQASRRPPVELLTRLQPSGGTNIHAAISAGAQAFAELGENDGALRRVVLLTDGVPTIGVKDPVGLQSLAKRLHADGITLSCQGFGADADGSLLTTMAELSGGTFLYVDKGELAVRAFEIELAQVLSTVATRTEVRLEPGPGVELEKVVSWEPIPDGAMTLVRVGDVPAEMERKVVMRLRWLDEAKSGDTVNLGRVHWTTVRVEDGKTFSGSAPISAALAATPEQSVASIQPHLRVKLVDAQFAENLERVKVLLDRGELKQAQVLAKENYIFLTENNPTANTYGDRAFVTNTPGVTFYTSGALPDSIDEARNMIEGALLPVGK